MCIATRKVMLFATGLLLKISAQKRKAGEEGVNGLETSKFTNMYSILGPKIPFLYDL